MKKLAVKMQSLADTFKKAIPEILIVGGAVCISYGTYLLSKPFGFIALGCLAICGAFLWSKSE